MNKTLILILAITLLLAATYVESKFDVNLEASPGRKLWGIPSWAKRAAERARQIVNSKVAAARAYADRIKKEAAKRLKLKKIREAAARLKAKIRAALKKKNDALAKKLREEKSKVLAAARKAKAAAKRAAAKARAATKKVMKKVKAATKKASATVQKKVHKLENRVKIMKKDAKKLVKILKKGKANIKKAQLKVKSSTTKSAKKLAKKTVQALKSKVRVVRKRINLVKRVVIVITTEIITTVIKVVVVRKVRVSCCDKISTRVKEITKKMMIERTGLKKALLHLQWLRKAKGKCLKSRTCYPTPKKCCRDLTKEKKTLSAKLVSATKSKNKKAIDAVKSDIAWWKKEVKVCVKDSYNSKQCPKPRKRCCRDCNNDLANNLKQLKKLKKTDKGYAKLAKENVMLQREKKICKKCPPLPQKKCCAEVKKQTTYQRAEKANAVRTKNTKLVAKLTKELTMRAKESKICWKDGHKKCKKPPVPKARCCKFVRSQLEITAKAKSLLKRSDWKGRLKLNAKLAMLMRERRVCLKQGTSKCPNPPPVRCCYHVNADMKMAVKDLLSYKKKNPKNTKGIADRAAALKALKEQEKVCMKTGTKKCPKPPKRCCHAVTANLSELEKLEASLKAGQPKNSKVFVMINTKREWLLLQKNICMKTGTRKCPAPIKKRCCQEVATQMKAQKAEYKAAQQKGDNHNAFALEGKLAIREKEMKICIKAGVGKCPLPTKKRCCTAVAASLSGLAKLEAGLKTGQPKDAKVFVMIKTKREMLMKQKKICMKTGTPKCPKPVLERCCLDVVKDLTKALFAKMAYQKKNPKDAKGIAHKEAVLKGFVAQKKICLGPGKTPKGSNKKCAEKAKKLIKRCCRLYPKLEAENAKQMKAARKAKDTKKIN